MPRPDRPLTWRDAAAWVAVLGLLAAFWLASRWTSWWTWWWASPPRSSTRRPSNSGRRPADSTTTRAGGKAGRCGHPRSARRGVV